MNNVLAGLVRVVALDGSVWWVQPASAAWYAALPQAKCYAAVEPRGEARSF